MDDLIKVIEDLKRVDHHTVKEELWRLEELVRYSRHQELDEESVSDEIQLRYFKLMHPDVTESDAEIVANSLAKAICAKFKAITNVHLEVDVEAMCKLITEHIHEKESTDLTTAKYISDNITKWARLVRK